MRFEEPRTLYSTGKALGFIVSYALFTTILFFALSLTHKMPTDWTALHVAGVTAAIVIVAALVRRLLL